MVFYRNCPQHCLSCRRKFRGSMGGRVAERIIKRLPVTFSDGKNEYKGTTANISHSGVFIRTRHILKPGTIIKIEMELENDLMMELVGIVVRFVKVGSTVFKDGIGVQLVTIPQEYNDLIDKLISEQN